MSVKQRKNHNEKDMVLRMGVVTALILLVLIAVVVIHGILNPRAHTKTGLEKLTQMDQADVKVIDAKIQELEKTEKEEDEALANRPANEKFANAMLMGDAISEGFVDYEILNEAQVLADADSGVMDSENNARDTQTAKAESKAPQVLFLAYGRNDLAVSAGDAEAFAVAYQKLVDELKEKLPNTEIYINSILPIQENKAEGTEQSGAVTEFNLRLQKLCEEEQITFVDCTTLVTEEDYAEDGIHMASGFYTKWMEQMLETAEL